MNSNHFGSRRIFGEKRSLFDLEDDDQAVQLTHRGTDLERIDYRLKEDDSSDDDYQAKLLQAHNFVGPSLDKKKTKEEIYKEIIKKSKQYKLER